MNIKNMLLGLAIGDAFGAGIEFQDRDWIKANIDFTQFVNARHLIAVPENQKSLFTENYYAWNYTDDTEMTIGVIKALLSQKPFTPDLLVDYWTKEYQEGIATKGFGRNGHGSMRWVFSGEKSIKEVRDFQRDRDYPGNAPPMRAVPLGLLPSHLINEYAIINADATHPHPKARAASILVARAAEFFLAKKGNATNITSYCLPHILQVDQETVDLIQRVDQLPSPSKLEEHHYKILCGPQPIVPPRFLPNIKGLPSDAMLTGGAVLYILKHTKDAFDGLKQSINLGGDVDSVASICTGILAGRYGLSSLPAFMLENVEGRTYLEVIGGEFKHSL